MSRKFYTGIDLQNNRMINVASPSTSTDGVNKTYVDNLINGLQWKQSVQAATTTSGTLNSSFAAGQVIDGYTLVTNDRILIKNQTTASQNGLYTVNATGAPSISPDGGTGELTTNSTVRINNGSVNIDSAWTLTTTGTITVGTTNQTWAQTNAGTPYLAGNGLSLTSTTFSVNAGNGIIADGTSTRINGSIVGQKYTVAIGDGSSTSYTVTHNLGNARPITSISNTSTGEVVDADIVNTSTTVVTITFASAPATNAYTVAIVG